MTGLVFIQEVPEQLPEAQLPLGIPFTRWFFGASQGVQIALVSTAAAFVLVLLILAFLRRRPIAEWLGSRTTGVRIGVGLAALVLLGSVLGASRESWNYVQHDNEFCVGCHVMDSAFDRFTESGHADLSCHDCHQQSVFASMRQLREWVRDRPEEIGEHSRVPNEICGNCHIDDDPEDSWAQIAATPGHVAHLESDSTALAELQCVDCHGQEVHEFVPADQTCAQADCHTAETTEIVLGSMSQETGLHCVTCHEFTADPVAPTAVDSVTGLLSPGLRQCTSCHEMEALWADYDPLLDPHDAECGACHNPHEQERPEVALRSCTDAGCHARPDTLSTFHIGVGEAIEEDCTGCHQPHVWVRDGNDCASCHTDIPGAVALVPRPPVGAYHELNDDRAGGWLARDDARASHPAADLGLGRGVGFVTLRHVEPEPSNGARATATHVSAARSTGWSPVSPQQQSFTHDDHTTVVCTGCHSNARRHGEVTVRTQSDCFSCHHSTQTASAQGCGECHTPADLGREEFVSASVRMSVWDESRVRGLPFGHDGHTTLRCVDCHGGGTRQQVQTSCSNCHEDHHESQATADCAACHEEHRAPVHTAEVHTDGCTGSGCHDSSRYERMDRTRAFCSTCHQDMIDHEPQDTCMSCHLVPGNEPARAGAR